jgi:hypothetical protein
VFFIAHRFTPAGAVGSECVFIRLVKCYNREYCMDGGTPDLIVWPPLTCPEGESTLSRSIHRRHDGRTVHLMLTSLGKLHCGQS